MSVFRAFRLRTGRLLLRTFVIEDAAAFHSIVNQPEVMRFLPENVMSREESDRILRWLIKSYDVNTPESIRKFTVAVVGGSERIVGWCGLGPLEYDSSQIELYYGITRSEWGKGYATEAAAAILRYGFDVIGLREIVAVVSPDNLGSIRVAEKLQMVRAGTVRGLRSGHSHYEGMVVFRSAAERQDARGGQFPHAGDFHEPKEDHEEVRKEHSRERQEVEGIHG